MASPPNEFQRLADANASLAEANDRLAEANRSLARAMDGQGEYFRRMADHLATTADVQERWIKAFSDFYDKLEDESRRTRWVTYWWLGTALLTAVLTGTGVLLNNTCYEGSPANIEYSPTNVIDLGDCAKGECEQGDSASAQQAEGTKVQPAAEPGEADLEETP